jgi:PAS domain S-box-containing protein
MESLLSEHAPQEVIEQMPVAIAVYDGQMRYRAVSRRHLADLAWLFSTEVLPPDKVIGRAFFDVSPKAPPRWGDAHNRVLAGEELSKEEDFVPRQDGRVVWVRWTMRPWRDSYGRVGGALLFSELITDQIEIRHALYESESRARATFENAAVGIAHVTSDGRFLRFNHAFSRIVGWPANELITKTVEGLTLPDDLPHELAQLQAMRDGETNSYVIDKRGLRKDGTIVWIRRTVSCVRKHDGSIDYFVCVDEDISARKHAEDQVQFLIREANHRIKNLLGLVQVIARQTVAGSVREFIGHFTERIQALAANQDLLGRDVRRGADLETLVRAQLAHLADLVESRITVHGPNLHVNTTAAQAIGLAVHELATNACKYGALSTDAGRVDVGWWLDGDALTMSWTERDGPPVQPPDYRGFGTTVINTMARRALSGDVQIDYARSGLTWRLTCPAPNALEPEHS